MDFKILLGIIPLAFGVVNHFRWFAPSPDDLSKRIVQKKIELTELLVKSHLRLFENFRKNMRFDDIGPGLTAEKALRGDDHSEEDYYLTYSKDLFRLTSIFSRLDGIQLRSRLMFHFQFILTVIGVLFFFVIFLIELNTKFYIAGFGVVFLLQVACLTVLRSCENKIKDYEDTI